MTSENWGIFVAPPPSPVDTPADIVQGNVGIE